MPPKSLDIFRTIGVGLCTNGPVLLSEAESEERKHVITIANFDKNKDSRLICCKTTSKLERMFPGQFIIDDLFGRGQSKVQPYNICRVKADRITEFYYLGMLDSKYLLQFEKGIKIAIAQKLFTAKEQINVLNSWSPFFGN